MFVFFSVSAGASDNPFVAKKPEEKDGIKLPAVATNVLGKIMIWQHQLNTKLTEQVKKIKDERSWNTLLQFENKSEELSVNSRLRWIPQSGREVVLVLNHGFARAGADIDRRPRFRSQVSDLVVKASYTLRY